VPETIIRQDGGGKFEQWQAELTADLVTLWTPSGKVLLQWPPATVAKSVRFPSFSKSIKYVGFYTADGVYQFSLNGAQLKALRLLADRGMAAAGPKAARSILTKAILWSVFGFAFMCLGIVMLTITVHEVATNTSDTNGSPHPVGFVSSLVGFAVLCRGIYGFIRYSRVKKLASMGS
jgi:hypothetical protein